MDCKTCQHCPDFQDIWADGRYSFSMGNCKKIVSIEHDTPISHGYHKISFEIEHDKNSGSFVFDEQEITSCKLHEPKEQEE